jgi:hypothetical protein
MADAKGLAQLACREVASGAAARPALPRSGAAAARLPSGDVLMFGGYTEEAAAPGAGGGVPRRAATDEAWVFSATAEAWRRLAPAPGAPAPRARLVAPLAVAAGAAFVLGGWDPGAAGDGGEILGDIWRLDLGDASDPSSNGLEHARWERIAPAGAPFPPASRHAAAAVGDEVFIHTHRCGNHILVLDAAAEPLALRAEPVLPDAAAGAPTARGLHSLVALGRTLWLFGGAAQSGAVTGDLWALDTAAAPLRWRRVEAGGACAPSARCSAAAAPLGAGALLLLGGAAPAPGGGLRGLDDAWVFDASTEEWRAVALTGAAPRGRNAAAAAPLGPEGSGKVLLHGGWLAFQETYGDSFVLG